MLYVAMMLLWLPWHFLSCAVGNHGHAPQMCDGVRPTTSLGSPCIQNMLFRFWTSDIMILDIFHVLSCAFMHCRILSKTQLSLPKGLRPATSVNGSSFAAFPCASPLIRWRSWSVRIFCGSCTAVFQHESKNLDQIDSHLEIYNDTYYIYIAYIYIFTIHVYSNHSNPKSKSLKGNTSALPTLCRSNIIAKLQNIMQPLVERSCVNRLPSTPFTGGQLTHPSCHVQPTLRSLLAPDIQKVLFLGCPEDKKNCYGATATKAIPKSSR